MAEDKLAGAIRPTLFIGLGGSGKEVLLRLRRKFYEKYRESPPCVKYLWLDTDTRDVMAQAEKMDDIYRAVSFTKDEQIPLLEGRVKDDLADVFRSKNRHEHIHRWLHGDVERLGAEISDGAGGVRSVGRLTFFYHYAERIVPRINHVLRTTPEEVIMASKKWFREKGWSDEDISKTDFDPAHQVFLVCSVAGGTGGGTFLDTAFFLRKLIQQEKLNIERILGIILLPNIYYSMPRGERALRSYGNAYAALKELEFYTVRRKPLSDKGNDTGLSIDFEPEWERGINPIQGPPFSVSFILENQNEAGIGVDTRSELFHMVAESLYLDFMPGVFSTTKRSSYSNATESLHGEKGFNYKVTGKGAGIPQSFARRYASFGMSKMEIPLDSIKGACAAQLAADIIKWWEREKNDPKLPTLLLEDMRRESFDASGLINRFLDDWKKDLETEISKIFRAVKLENPKQVEEVEVHLETFEREELHEEGKKSKISFIRRKTKTVLEKLQEDLRQWTINCLEEESRGLKSLIQKDGYLHLLIRYLREYFTSKGEGYRATYDETKAKAQEDANRYRDDVEKNLSELRTALKSLGVTILGLRPWLVTELLERLKDAKRKYALSMIQICLAEEAAKVAKGVVDIVEKERTLMERFGEKLDLLASSSKGKRDGFLNISEGVLSVRLFDEKTDWPKFYFLGVDSNGNPLKPDVNRESQKFLARSFPEGRTLWELIELFAREGEAGVATRLTDFCEERFRDDFEARPATIKDYGKEVDVLRHWQFAQRKEEFIDKLVRCALPMVRRNSQLGGEQVIKEVYIGIAEKEETGDVYRTFINGMKEKLNARGYAADAVRVLYTGDPTQVYVYVISYAFPLPSLTTVSYDCHKAYYDFYHAVGTGQIGAQGGQEYQKIPLHLSWEWEGKFDDLMIYGDREIAEIKRAREILLFAPIVRVLELKESNGQLEFGYKKWVPPAPRREPLGRKRESEEVLRSDPRLADVLWNITQQKEQQLSSEQLESYYWLLCYLSRGGNYPEGTSERSLLDKKVDEVFSKLGQSAKLVLPQADDKKIAEEAKTRIMTKSEWVGSFPILRDVEPWVRRD